MRMCEREGGNLAAQTEVLKAGIEDTGQKTCSCSRIGDFTCFETRHRK